MTQPQYTQEQVAALLAQAQAAQAQIAPPAPSFPQFNGLAPGQQAGPAFPAPTPQNATPAPQPVNAGLDDFFGQKASAGGPGLPIGEPTPIGTVFLVEFTEDISDVHVRQQTKPKSGELQWNKDNTPSLVMVAPVKRLDNGEDASWWVAGAGWSSLKSAMAAVGVQGAPKQGDRAAIQIASRYRNSFGTQSTRIQVTYQPGSRWSAVTPPAELVESTPAAPELPTDRPVDTSAVPATPAQAPVAATPPAADVAALSGDAAALLAQMSGTAPQA